MKALKEELGSTSYPGRGIIVGTSADGTKAITAYWIMGRSENSRNRVFVEENDGIRTQAFDPSKLTDPSLIIYAPVRVLGTDTIVTNGDQTDTIYDGLKNGLSFSKSLESRQFEPDAPNFTPRISAILHLADKKYSYELSILKTDAGDGDTCCRYTFSYTNAKRGQGRYIHTYMDDGNPLPSFQGEPVAVQLEGSIDELTQTIWGSLNDDNKVSLFVRFIDIATGKAETRIINKNR